MKYEERFTDAELFRIIEEGFIYMCACPAQVAVALLKTRDLYKYQLNCLQDSGNDSNVHSVIAAATAQAHATLETCMEEVLVLEKWDRATLKMPSHLRKKQADRVDDFRSDKSLPANPSS